LIQQACSLLQIARDKLVALGTCIGKFTHSGKFRLTIGCLDILSQYTKYKVSITCDGVRVCMHVVCLFSSLALLARGCENDFSLQPETDMWILIKIPTLGLRAAVKHVTFEYLKSFREEHDALMRSSIAAPPFFSLPVCRFGSSLPLSCRTCMATTS